MKFTVVADLEDGNMKCPIRTIASFRQFPIATFRQTIGLKHIFNPFNLLHSFRGRNFAIVSFWDNQKNCTKHWCPRNVVKNERKGRRAFVKTGGEFKWGKNQLKTLAPNKYYISLSQ
jgi:hypothetical protein